MALPVCLLFAAVSGQALAASGSTRLTIHLDQAAVDAIARMKRALYEYIITGVKTNIDFHKAIMENPRFVTGDIDTHFIEKEKTLFDDLKAISARESQLADKLISSQDKAKKAALIAASAAAAILTKTQPRQ